VVFFGNKRAKTWFSDLSFWPVCDWIQRAQVCSLWKPYTRISRFFSRWSTSSKL